MRRLLAAALLSLISLALVLPLLLPADSALPPCCRRHGKHHCAMMEVFLGHRTGVQTLRERCPFERLGKTVAHTAAYRPEPSARFLAICLGLPARVAQVQALGRIAFDRSRLKRGPPPILL